MFSLEFITEKTEICFLGKYVPLYTEKTEICFPENLIIGHTENSFSENIIMFSRKTDKCFHWN